MVLFEEESTKSAKRGVWFCSRLSTQFPEHAHAGVELNLLMAGELRYRVGERELVVRAGQVLVLAPGERHQILHASQEAAFWVVELAGRPSQRWLEESAVLWMTPVWMRRAAGLVKRLWLRPAQAAEESLWHAFEDLLEEGAPAGDARRLDLHPAVTKARAVCLASTEQELSMGSLGKQVGISPSRLSHLFQEQLGLSPLQYRNFCRVQRFISAHAEKDPNLMRAALRAGFGSYPQFHRTFRQVCGAAPAAHLERLAEDAWMSPTRTLPLREPLPGEHAAPAIHP